MKLREISIDTLTLNPFAKIGHEWMLITAGDAEKHNTMTASWGGLGYLWERNIATIFIRPQRYTYEFVERGGYYSLCFFGEEYRDALNLCGYKSGRDCDKPKAAGLTPNFTEPAPYYEEASLVLLCRKLYHQDLEEALFADSTIVEQFYPKRDLHRFYVGEIVKVLGA